MDQINNIKKIMKTELISLENIRAFVWNNFDKDF